MTLQTVIFEVGMFSDTTFGTKRPYTAPLHHLKKEVDECIESGSLEEFADCLLLLMDAYRKRFNGKNMHDSDLIEACLKKLEVCKKRDWGKPDENGVIEHLR